MLNRDSSVPIYIQIQELLEEMLNSGTLKPLDLVPSENELAEKLKVSRLTVRKSYGEMVRRGLFFTIQGKGTFVQGTTEKDTNPKEDTVQTQKVIGVILPEISGFYGDIFSGIKHECEARGYSVEIMFNNERSCEVTAIQHMLTDGVAGIIISPSRHAGSIIEHYQKLLSSQTPTVMVGKAPFKIFAPNVHCDDTMGVYRAVELLIAHENTRIGYVGDNSYQDEASQERFTGYTAAMRDYLPSNGLSVFDMVDPTFEASIVQSQMGDAPITAFFCYCDLAASKVYSILTKAGKRIPEDVEIVGYDNIANTDVFGIDKTITSIDQRRILMGEETVSLLCNIIAKPERKHTHMEIVVHPKVIEKETTRAYHD